MIKKKDYKKAKAIVKQYEQEQLTIPVVSSRLTIEQIESITFNVVGQFPYSLKHMGKLHPMTNVHGKMCINGEYYEFINGY